MVQQDMQPKRFNAQQVKQARACLALAICLGLCGLVWSACTASVGGGPAVFWPVAVCVVPALCALVVALADFPALYFGWRVQRDFEQVCAGVGLSGIGSYLSSWKGIAKYGLLDLSGKGRMNGVVIHPKLYNLEGNFEQWTAGIVPLYGQAVDDFSAQEQAFALAFNVSYVSFERGNGVIHIRAGDVQVPEVYEHAVLPPAVSLQAIPMAVDMTGKPWMMPIEGQHVLVAGRTGSGKGSILWGLVFGLAYARQVGLVRLIGCDPKKVELALGRSRWDAYADTVEGIVELLEQAVYDMSQRSAALQGKARKFTPSKETPLVVIVIDEIGYLSAMVPDKKLRDRAEKAISTILALGRALGYSIVGAVQDPRKETVGFRDLFPIRIALGLEAAMVDLVLGDGMHDAGALCEQIPRKTGAGTGYVISEEDAKPLLVRAAWCSDEAIKGELGAPADAMLETPPLDYQPYEQGLPPQFGFDGQPFN